MKEFKDWNRCLGGVVLWFYSNREGVQSLLCKCTGAMHRACSSQKHDLEHWSLTAGKDGLGDRCHNL